MEGRILNLNSEEGGSSGNAETATLQDVTPFPLTILINWMGLKHFEEAVKTDSLGFERLEFMLGYGGNGAGLLSFKVGHGTNKTFNYWQESMFGDLDKAVEIQIMHRCPFIGRKERRRLVKEILRLSNSFDMEPGEFKKLVAQESYRDVDGDESLKAAIFAAENGPTGAVDLARLSNIKPDTVKILGLDGVKDASDLVLRIAEINLEILIAHGRGACDMGTSAGAERLLKSKLLRNGVGVPANRQFSSLLELCNIPQIGAAIESGDLTVGDVWVLRKKRSSRRFRRWLRDAAVENARDLEKAYVASLGKKSLISSLPARVLRFSITTSSSAFGAVVSGAAGLLDSFFVEKWLSGYSPKLFLDEVRKLPNSV